MTPEEYVDIDEEEEEWEDLLWDEYWGEREDDEKYADEDDC